MNLKTKFSQLVQRPVKSCESQGDATRCFGCKREVPLHDFHHIPDMVALKSLQGSIIRESATSGSMLVPGRYAIGEQYRSFVYCEDCDKKLSLAEKKVLVWHLCAHSPACDEQDALCRLRRGEHLCAQIDNGL